MSLKRTNLNSIVNLRTTVDENLTNSMSALGYSESFSLIDTKLALGYLTAVISAGLYFADKKYGFNDTFYLTVVAVALYFAISGVYWYYTSSSEFKNINYVGYTGEKSKKSKITVAAWTTKFEPIYNVKIVVGEGKSKEVINTGFEFMKLFDGMGFYQEQELTKLIKAEIEKVTKKNL